MDIFVNLYRAIDMKDHARLNDLRNRVVSADPVSVAIMTFSPFARVVRVQTRGDFLDRLYARWEDC